MQAPTNPTCFAGALFDGTPVNPIVVANSTPQGFSTAAGVAIQRFPAGAAAGDYLVTCDTGFAIARTGNVSVVQVVSPWTAALPTSAAVIQQTNTTWRILISQNAVATDAVFMFVIHRTAQG